MGNSLHTAVMSKDKAKTKLELGWKSLTDEEADEKVKRLSDEEAEAVTHLFIQRNKLTRMPAGLERLKNLKLIDASHNEIAELPSALGRLPELHTLYLQTNKLTELAPRAFATLNKLDVLWVEDNEGLGERAINVGKPFHEDRDAVVALLGKKK